MIDNELALTELEKALKTILVKSGNTKMVDKPLKAAVLVFSFDGNAGIVTASTSPIEAIMNMAAVMSQLIAGFSSMEDRIAISIAVTKAMAAAVTSPQSAEVINLTQQPLKS